MLAFVVSSLVGSAELFLLALTLLAGGHAVWRIRNDDPVEGIVLIGLMVLGAFCLVALDAARRGAGL